MVLPRGAWPDGLKSNTLLPRKYLFTVTWNPAACSTWVACSTVMPTGLGTGTSWGPVDTRTTTVWPGWNVAPAAGSWLVMTPAGCWLLPSGCCCRFTWYWPASCWAASKLIPVKLGSGGPDATRIVTVLVCGQVLPAGGLVPIAVPIGALEPTFWTVVTRCTCCSAACAAACVLPRTVGTTEVKGPSATTRVTVAPFDTRPVGLVPTTL